MSGVWAFGLVEMVSAKNELCAILVDEESEMLEVRVFPIARRDAEIAVLVSSMREQIGEPRTFVVPNRGAADALRRAGIREEIEIAQSLALEDAIRTLDETLRNGSSMDSEDEDPQKGEDEIELTNLCSFYEAAERFLSCAPWSRFPPGATFEVRAPALEIERGGVFLMGADVESAGWVFAFSEEDVDGMPFLDGATDEPSSAMAMYMQPLDMLGAGIERLVKEARGIVTKDKLVPVLARSVRGPGLVRPSASDYELATALCSALTRLSENASGKVQVETAKGAAVCVEGPIEGEQ
jgi:hypothetical protein